MSHLKRLVVSIKHLTAFHVYNFSIYTISPIRCSISQPVAVHKAAKNAEISSNQGNIGRGEVYVTSHMNVDLLILSRLFSPLVLQTEAICRRSTLSYSSMMTVMSSSDVSDADFNELKEKFRSLIEPSKYTSLSL
jgi:hypothetical protein